MSTQTDIVATIFNNDPLVYWGFSGGTGDLFNDQRFCTPLNPGFNVNFSNDTTCIGTPVIFVDSSVSYTTIQNYFWDFGDGTTSTQANPPPHNFLQPGQYKVKHSITAADGCSSDSEITTISVFDKPVVSFNIYDTCISFAPRLENNTTINTGTVSQWNWQLDGTGLPDTAYPVISNIAPGNHTLQLTATSNIGCISDPVTKTFNMQNKPAVNITAGNGCIDESISFTAIQIDNLITVNSWYWNFGDGQSSVDKDPNHSYTAKGMYPVELIATSAEGCSDSSSKNIFINEAIAFAGNDTVVIANTPFRLHGSGGDFYSWSPATGLSDPDLPDPAGIVNDGIDYLLTVSTVEGCTDTASVRVTVVKGSAIYVPTGFTPNHDGRNDILKPYYIGIKSLSYFTIYNRWGQKVFSTSNLNEGWNGSFNGRNLESDSFVWILKASDLNGRAYVLKGSFMLLR